MGGASPLETTRFTDEFRGASSLASGVWEMTAPTGSLLDLIGKTPMVEVTKIDTGKCRLFLKLEAQNPGGSIKDRIAISMIDAAEREGWLKPGGTIVEATAGNTGLALTLGREGGVVRRERVDRGIGWDGDQPHVVWRLQMSWKWRKVA